MELSLAIPTGPELFCKECGDPLTVDTETIEGADIEYTYIHIKSSGECSLEGKKGKLRLTLVRLIPIHEQE